jgi:hypothetical protein
VFSHAGFRDIRPGPIASPSLHAYVGEMTNLSAIFLAFSTLWLSSQRAPDCHDTHLFELNGLSATVAAHLRMRRHASWLRKQV